MFQAFPAKAGTIPRDELRLDSKGAETRMFPTKDLHQGSEYTLLVSLQWLPFLRLKVKSERKQNHTCVHTGYDFDQPPFHKVVSGHESPPYIWCGSEVPGTRLANGAGSQR